ncbi:Predicted nucleotidyltransferase [Oscillibacter sp. PC13]|uniref:tRNA(Met) cytidine acetate ligase n=1 Tax=Oscillibacter sp. PC13 TaxID=1855299 RepID=UPI0008DFE30D|nr:nucleotidyltransferase family protein [Oscillibacter sp. PC13]SFP70532.1 Predicted nucleotidyltransferase [Oscillibacter sp. PC13]
MQIAGIIIEYNPMHSGHMHLLKETRARLGANGAIICVMSGNFVQRGDFAVLGKLPRAEAAVRSGADLVLELPLPWAVSSAERFADGGVQALMATGLVTHLAFGSECGDAAALQRVASALVSEVFSHHLKRELPLGNSFAAARQRAAAALLPPEDVSLLSAPNNILGVEYCKSLLLHHSAMQPLTVPRRGAAHDDETAREEHPSASALRARLRNGERDAAMVLMTPAMAEIYRREEDAGRAPVFGNICERAVLARLRSMTEAEFSMLDEGREGLCNRLYAASRKAASLEELLAAAKTKRYAYARLRRMTLWAYLGLMPADFPKNLPYLRVLAANRTGCGLLAKMRKCAVLPVLTKPADVRRLDTAARRLFAQEARATDLYTLAYPNLAAAAGGTEWKEGPVIL